jgi:hypothetical protein
MKFAGIREANWSRLLLWTPLLVGGVVAAFLATRSRRLRRAVKRLLAEDPLTEESQELLCSAIIGNDKEAIASAFGPPRTALHRGVPTETDAEQYFSADTWYYPFDQADQTAVVIEFDRGIARSAQFIQSPRRVEQRESE